MKKPVHPRRFLITSAGRDEEAIEKMKHEFAKLADVNAQNRALNQKTNNMAETFNPIRREMLNSGQIEDEWDKYTTQLLTPNEVRKLSRYVPQEEKNYERVVYNKPVETWTCRYCGGIRTGDRCKGCGAIRIKAEG